MNTVQKSVNYKRIIKDLKAIISSGADNIKRAYKTQVLKTNWEIGRYLNQTLPLDASPSANNARIIGRLVKEFDRPDSYFYMLIKFYRLYPQLPEDGKLSWSHYEVLLRIEDSRKRGIYQALALQKEMSAKHLYGLIVNDKIKQNAFKKISLAGSLSAKIPFTRGRLYYYKVTAPKSAAANNGTATLDAGFKVFRDIPLHKKSKLHVGHMVRTVRSAKSRDTFLTKIAQPAESRLYTYMASVERVVDGDTLIAMIDLGLKTKTSQRLRLRGIDTPEITTKRGKYVSDYVKKILTKQEFIIVKTYKDDKFGRMLADVFYLPKEKDPAAVAAEGIFLNQQLLDEGMAEGYA